MVPQTVQEPAVDEENILEVSGELTERMELADHIVICRRIPVEDLEEEDNANSKPVPTSVNDSGSEEGDIIRDAKFFQDAATEFSKHFSLLMRNILINLFWLRRHLRPLKPPKAV